MKTKKEKAKRRKENAKKAMPKIVISLLVALVTTISFYFRGLGSIIRELSQIDSLWGVAAIMASIFLFAFAFTFGLLYWKENMKKTKIKAETIFIIISAVISGLSVWTHREIYNSTWEILLAFSLGVGICYMIFTIFHRFDYHSITKCAIQLVKNIFYYVLLPSMFLIIALIGKIDKDGSFMVSASESLSKAGGFLSVASIKLVSEIYHLGQYKYSTLFMIAIFVTCLFYATYDFFKKSSKLDFRKKPRLSREKKE